MSLQINRVFSRWWKEHGKSRIDQTAVSILDCGRELAGPRNRVFLKEEMRKWDGRLPLVSCLMVTKNRANLARCALRSFLNQSYPHKELVIIDDGEDEEFACYTKQLKDSRIRHIRLPTRKKSLGGLRNMSVEIAKGDLVCQWDDDDLSDPLRLAMQVCAMVSFKAEACLLRQEMMWWPHQNRLAISTKRIWEGSSMAKKANLTPYPAISKGEDTPVVKNLLHTAKVVILDNPHLYLYVVHGTNTFDAQHFDLHWVKAEETFEHAKYETLLEQLSLRMPIDAYRAALKDGTRSG